MNHQNIPLTDLTPNKNAKITSVGGGYGLQRKLQTLGIREGQGVQVSSRQPFRGPLTIKVCGSQITLGRGIAKRIMVKEL